MGAGSEAPRGEDLHVEVEGLFKGIGVEFRMFPVYLFTTVSLKDPALQRCDRVWKSCP